jgi:hypothetical protein
MQGVPRRILFRLHKNRAGSGYIALRRKSPSATEPRFPETLSQKLARLRPAGYYPSRNARAIPTLFAHQYSSLRHKKHSQCAPPLGFQTGAASSLKVLKN